MPWNPTDYAQHSSAQLAWGRELIARLRLRGDEAILDVGCGDGKLTAELAAAVPRGSVLGVDANLEFINYAQQHYPPARFSNLEFRQMDARQLKAVRSFDVVFSNAALHWVADHRAFLKGCAHLLRPGGRLTTSCGGAGNMSEIVAALESVIAAEPWRRFFGDFDFPYYFYTPAEYSAWLAEAGLQARHLALVEKDMIHDGAEGLAAWLRTTWMPYTDRVPEAMRGELIGQITTAYLANHPLDPAGRSHVNAVRLEVEAQK
jgi:trans-aconitate 2-methyltransferase